MKPWSRILALSSFGFLVAVSFAPERSAAGALVPQPGCRPPSTAVADFVEAWLGSFMTNGVGGFPKLCEKICKDGSKGCERVRRGTLSCNLDSLDALSAVDATQCRELPEPDRTACLENVEELTLQQRENLTSDAAGAADACADAVGDCVDFCIGTPI
jgi:hypothetical protein